jgi:pimeloyl-ACP methyl ester carboxylesterase
MGLAGQLIFWPPEFVAALADAGFRVIRHDNRDIGLSQKIEGKKPPPPLVHLALRRAGVRGLSAYTLEDMAKDAIGVLTELDVGPAHIVGVSMGGMIGQALAANAPARVRSLTAIMSSTNHPRLPQAKPNVMRAMARRAKPDETREQSLDRMMRTWNLIRTPNGGLSEAELRARLAAQYDRCWHPQGPQRQLAAIIDAGDLRHYARLIKAPTLVIHGADDPLARPEGGRDIADHVEGARLEIIDGMAHDLAKKFLPKISALVIEHMRAH